MASKLLEGLRRLYSGKDIVNKQIILFSIIGIVSLFSAYMYLGNANYFTLKSYIIYVVTSINMLWIFYGIGYETKFLNNVLNNNNDNILPEFNLLPFKITCTKFLMLLFVINSLYILMAIFSHKQNLIFVISIFLSIILSLFQIGYSQKYSNEDLLDVFKVLTFKDYLLTTTKKLWLTFLSYLTSYGIVFILIMIAGLIILLTGFSHSKSFTEIMFAAQSSHLALIKLTTYFTTVLLNYFLLIFNFAWEYDLIENYKEKKGGN